MYNSVDFELKVEWDSSSAEGKAKNISFWKNYFWSVCCYSNEHWTFFTDDAFGYTTVVYLMFSDS